MSRVPLVAGNWKMNGLQDALAEARQVKKANGDVLICPPATLIAPMAGALAGSGIDVGGQDCHVAATGAHTGDISPEMLADAGARAVILGHSERRSDHGESSDLVREKAAAAWRADLIAIVCVGESALHREARNTLDIISGQLAASIPDGATGQNLVVAYEPLWAIGSGKTPSLDEIGEVHDHMRARLERRFGAGVGRSVRLLYGGSVKPDNAGDIFAVSNVDGGLIGGASLKAQDFNTIIAAA